MRVLLAFGLFIAVAEGYQIQLEVPAYGDPLQETNLVCHFKIKPTDPALHAVSFYREMDEIFKFTPGHEPPTRIFNYTSGSISKGKCDMNSCTIGVKLPKTYNVIHSFTCKLSSVGPSNIDVQQTKSLTIAVTLKEDPKILTVPRTAQLQNILLNCTTQPAFPPADIMWYIDGKREKMNPRIPYNTKVSVANELGLKSSWRPLRLRVDTSKRFIYIRCEAIQPTYPPYKRCSNKTLATGRSSRISTFTTAGSSSTKLEATVLMLVLCFGTYIFEMQCLE